MAASPFISKREEWKAETSNSQLERVTSEKEIFYQAIKDVDFEFAEGKLTEKDHRELRDYYKEKAIQKVKEIEEIEREIKKQDSTQTKEEGRGE